MEIATAPARRVLMVVTGEPDDASVVEHGFRWARDHELDAVVFFAPADPHASHADIGTWRRRYLDRRGSRAGTELIVGHGPTTSSVAAMARHRRASLIVVGPGRRDGWRTEALLQRSPVPVLVTRGCSVPGHIVVGTDLKDPRFPVVRAGVHTAQRVGAIVTILHAVEPPVSGVKRGRGRLALGSDWQVERVDAAQRLLRRSLWVSEAWADSIVIESIAIDALDEVAQGLDANLIIVGTRRRRVGGRPALGTTARGLVRNASCSVLVVPLPPVP